ncbi:uncharacterized protein LOC144546633 [Carex rostrata]
MDPFHLRRINDDHDEYTIVITPHIERNLFEPTPCHTSILTGLMYVNEVLDGHECRCRREFRMESYVFRALVRLLKEKHLLSDGLVKVEEQVAMFLYSLAKNASNRSVQERFQHSGDTVSRYFNSVLNSINQRSSEIIIPPPLRTPQFIASRSEFYPYFKDCIGAIDGTHIPITIEEKKQDPFRNRKQILSQNVMVVCDFDRRFTYPNKTNKRKYKDLPA